MTPALEARLLALAATLGIEGARVEARPTVVRVLSRWEGATGAMGETEDAAAQALCCVLADRVRLSIESDRVLARCATDRADKTEAALSAALATGAP